MCVYYLYTVYNIKQCQYSQNSVVMNILKYMPEQLFPSRLCKPGVKTRSVLMEVTFINHLYNR